jgi:hypothetical protein
MEIYPHGARRSIPAIRIAVEKLKYFMKGG